MSKSRVCSGALLMMFSINASALEDPTRPPLAKGSASTEVALQQLPVLSSIIYSDSRKVAVVNGHLLGEGESKEGIALLHISPDNVRVRVGGAQQVTLTMNAGLIKKESK